MPLAEQKLTLGPSSLTVFGAGSIGQLGDAVRELGGSRAFLVTDRGLAATGIVKQAAASLAAAGVELEVYSDLDPNPAAEDIEAGGHALRRFGASIVVGLGGGTAIDGAKGISLAGANRLPVRELDYRNQIPVPGFPVIAVPTTAGTGSETNSFGVIEDHAVRRKFYIGNPSVSPRRVILDPALTAGLPPGPTAATGMDAMTHALESLMARHGNPYAEALDLQVIRVVHRWLPVAFERGGDLEARSQLLLAAHLAGLAFATTGLGLCHAIGHTLSAMLGTAHGVALAVVLPAVMELNLEERPGELARAGQVLGLAPAGSEGVASAGAAIAGVRALRQRLGLPSGLGEIGLEPGMLPELVRGTLDDIVLANNPVQPSPARLLALLEEGL